MYAHNNQPSVRRQLMLTALALWMVLPIAPVLAQRNQDVDYHVKEDNQRLEMVVNSSRIMYMDEDIPRVLVNNKEVIHVVPLSPTQVQVSALKPGVTQVNLWDKEGNVRSVDVIVSPDARQLEMVLRSEFPTAAIRVRPMESSVILAGYVDRPEVIGPIVAIAENFYPKIINNISVGGVQQVALHTKVMEVSRTKLRSLGFDFAWRSGGDFIIDSAAGLISNASTATNVVGTGADTIRFGIVGDNSRFDGFIDALRRNEIVKILAEPTLVTISGRPASFQEGGEFPIIVAQGIGANSVEFKQFGTRIDFVPIVLGNGNIRLECRPQVSEIDNSRGVDLGGFVVPGLRTRWVDTAAEMQSGQTLALAGLIQTRMESSNRGLPWLADLPFTGALFRRTREEANEIELLVTVRPELVMAMDPDQVPAAGPGEQTVSPNDVDLGFRGYLEVPRCCPQPRCTNSGGQPVGPAMGMPMMGDGSMVPMMEGTPQPAMEAGAGMMSGSQGAFAPSMGAFAPGMPQTPSMPYAAAPTASPYPPADAGYPASAPTIGAPGPAGNVPTAEAADTVSTPEMFGPSGYDNLDY